MFLKNAIEGPLESFRRVHRRPWSLALRMGLYYGVAAFLIIFVTTTLLYYALKSQLEYADDLRLQSKLKEVQPILVNEPLDVAALQASVQLEYISRSMEPVLIRVKDLEGKVIVETPDMNRALPVGSFKARGALRCLMERSKAGHRVFTTASTGNHGMAVAFAGCALGLETHIFVPQSAKELFRTVHPTYTPNGSSTQVPVPWNDSWWTAATMRNSSRSAATRGLFVIRPTIPGITRAYVRSFLPTTELSVRTTVLEPSAVGWSLPPGAVLPFGGEGSI